MPSLISMLVRCVCGPRPELFCSAALWQQSVAELKRRAGGEQESGAFLLGSKNRGRQIEEFYFYDDLDPDALRTGIVLIDGRKLGVLWAHCRATGRQVVADIHVHPAGYGQSSSDQDNPVVAEVGHLAIILPDFATQGH